MIGYRNQYVLAALFVNLILFSLSLKLWDPHEVVYDELVGLALANVILGPVVFFGPLLPFRDKMLREKRGELQVLNESIASQYEEARDSLKADNIKERYETLTVLKGLRENVEDVPVWPFDAE